MVVVVVPLTYSSGLSLHVCVCDYCPNYYGCIIGSLKNYVDVSDSELSDSFSPHVTRDQYGGGGGATNIQ